MLPWDRHYVKEECRVMVNIFHQNEQCISVVQLVAAWSSKVPIILLISNILTGIFGGWAVGLVLYLKSNLFISYHGVYSSSISFEPFYSISQHV